MLLFCLYVLGGCNNSNIKEQTVINDSLNKSINDTTQVKINIDSLFILLDLLKSDSVMKHASLGYVIKNITADSIITEHNASISLVPASTIKIITSAAALGILGPDARFKTVLSYDGKIEGRMLNGNLYIIGGGDPALGSAIYNQGAFLKTFINAVKALNIDTITGNIIGDPRIFSIDDVPYTWPWGEINSAYAAPSCGLTVYDNTYAYEIKKNEKGWIIPNSNKMIPLIPGMKFYHSYVISPLEKESLIITNLNGSTKKIIKGGFPAGYDKVTVEGSIPDPAYLIAFELFEGLLLNNVYVKGSPMNIYECDECLVSKADKKQIAVIYSPDVASIIMNVNQHSNNLFAEHLLRHIGLKRYGVGDAESGCNAVVSYWRSKGVDTEGLFMYDGCGLSRFNAITANQLTDILVFMHTSPHKEIFFNSLSKAGSTGTLRKLCVGTNAEQQISAKSGTMSRVKSYAGYAITLMGDTLAFAFIANNFTCPPADITQKFENIMIKMVELNRN